jgi:hypothetical protein
MHDSFSFVLQASQTNQAPSMQWGGSPTAGAPPIWPPPLLVGFWLPSRPGFLRLPLQPYLGQPGGYWPLPPWWGSPPGGRATLPPLGSPPGGLAPPPFESPTLGTTPLRPTTSMPPMVRCCFIYLLDYFTFLTHLFRIPHTSIYMSFRAA